MEEERKPEPFVRHGTEEERVEIPAEEVLNAIAEGRDIEILYAVINGNLDIWKIEDRLDRDEDGRRVIPGNIEIVVSEIRGYASFSAATFSGYASFSAATFSDYADFNAATFSDYADFSFATFNTRANFSGAKMKHPADFAAVRFRENTVRKRLWDYILRPILWLLIWLITIGKVKLSWKPITDFSGFNTTTVMDASSNPYLKRYIDDEQWIASWRGRSWLRRWPLFLLWEITSHCGRSISFWAFWSAAIAVIFGIRYWQIGCDSIAFNVDKLSGVQPGLLDYLYYSVVTFTTLGFGDIVPLTGPARFVVGLEVVFGYVMLGGLISIFANKLARRS